METHGNITLTCALVVSMSQDLCYIDEQVEIMQTSLEEDLSPRHWRLDHNDALDEAHGCTARTMGSGARDVDVRL